MVRRSNHVLNYHHYLGITVILLFEDFVTKEVSHMVLGKSTSGFSLICARIINITAISQYKDKLKAARISLSHQD